VLLLSSFCMFIPLVIIALSPKTSLFLLTYIVIELLQFFFLKLIFRNTPFYYIIFFYILLYCVNMIISSIAIAIVPNYRFHIDYLCNTFTSILCAIICFTNLRHALRQALQWTPKYVIIISLVLLVIAAIMSVLISAYQLSIFPDKWNRLIQVLTTFLLVAICVVVPVIFIISISNTRLKTLTADYEQQIHAQAEHYRKLAEANYEVRRFRHDFQNIRIAMTSLLERGEYEQARQLMAQSGDAMDSIQPLFSTGNGIADALLTDKQTRADTINTRITFSGVIPPDSLSPTDLCVLLGNSLDNALDACRKLPLSDPKTISVKCSCTGGFLFLTVCNPIGEKVTIRNNHIATTKEDKALHGYGLYSLHTIVKRYDGQIQLNATEDSFTVSIDLSLSAKH